jgi:hypothetical protein
MEEVLKPTEKKRLYRHRRHARQDHVYGFHVAPPPQSVAEIDTMKPALVYEVPRKA